MELILDKKPRDVTIIEGFPGFGLVGTITTEFLIDHLNAEKIGSIDIKESPPMVAVHSSKVVEPLGIFYDKKNNIVILHALSGIKGIEWELCEVLIKLAKKLNAKEIISLEGIGGEEKNTAPDAYFISSKSKLNNIGVKELKEGIVMGVTGALLLKKDDLPITCIFAETHSALPDSRAAAKVIEVLDKYLGLKVDYKPLIKKAEEFEGKLKGILEQAKSSQQQQQKKELSYLG